MHPAKIPATGPPGWIRVCLQMDSTEGLGCATPHYCPLYMPYLGRKGAEFRHSFAQTFFQRGIQKFYSLPTTEASLNSPLGHWCWPQAQNATQPTTMLDSHHVTSVRLKCMIWWLVFVVINSVLCQWVRHENISTHDAKMIHKWGLH